VQKWRLIRPGGGAKGSALTTKSDPAPSSSSSSGGSDASSSLASSGAAVSAAVSAGCWATKLATEVTADVSIGVAGEAGGALNGTSSLARISSGGGMLAKSSSVAEARDAHESARERSPNASEASSSKCDSMRLAAACSCCVVGGELCAGRDEAAFCSSDHMVLAKGVGKVDVRAERE